MSGGASRDGGVSRRRFLRALVAAWCVGGGRVSGRHAPLDDARVGRMAAWAG